MTMPVIFNEPLSLLQRMAEHMEYAYLLEKAGTATDPVERMQVGIDLGVKGGGRL